MAAMNNTPHSITADAVSSTAPKKSGNETPGSSPRCSKRCLVLGGVVLVGVIVLAIALPLALVSQGDGGGSKSSGSANGQYDPDDCQ